MRIALLTDGIYPHVMGGMQKHSYYLCKYLAGLGVHIDLYHTTKGASDPEEQLVDFTEAERARVRPFLVEYPTSDGWPGHYLRTSRQYSKRIFEHLQESGSAPDFIYAQGLTSWYLLQHRKKLGYAVPVGINVHGYEMFQIAATGRILLEQWMLRPAFRLINQEADWVFAFGGEIRRIAAGRAGAREDRIIEIPNGIATKWLIAEGPAVKRAGPLKFAYVGRFERRKGVQELNKAIQKLSASTPFEFHFIGPIPEAEQLDHPGVVYHGMIRNAADVQQLLTEGDVLVTPSYSEGMPTVILEAMACGCAVIATDVGAVRSMVDEQVGWLIPPANQQALQAALEAALACPDEALQARKLAARNRVESSFLWEHIARDTLTAIEKALSFGPKGL